ncbi:MAG: c-type cytochrome [Pseudomonadota bacterium]
MNLRHVIPLAAALLLPVSVHAAEETKEPEKPKDPMVQLFKDSGCHFCHYDAHQVIGPALIEISLKYKGNKDAATELAKKIRGGTTGTWGKLNMPETPAEVSDETIGTLTQWILARKDDPEMGEIIFAENACYRCHDNEKPALGPSLQSITDKYKNNKGAKGMLLGKVRTGGSGTWGATAMPATSTNISDESIGIVTDWMLNYKPKEEPKSK